MTSQVSEALKRIKPSATMAMSAKARALKAAGRGLHRAVARRFDFDTPGEHQGSRHPRHARRQDEHRCRRHPELKDTICAKFKRENGLTTSEQITFRPAASR